MRAGDKLSGGFNRPINWHQRDGLMTTLYFLRTPSRPTWLKIGLARDLAKRLHGMRLANPDIECVAYRTVPREFDRQIERMIHDALADRAQGREWFEVTLADAVKVAERIIARGKTAAGYVQYGSRGLA